MKILIVEDESELAELIRHALRRAGMQSDAFGEAAAAEHALRTGHYDAMLLDLGLPDGRGETLLGRLRRAGGTTPVLIVTATDAVQSRVDCLNLGADDYLVKPFDSDELVARVRALLRRPGGALGSTLVLGRLELDTVGRHASTSGAPVALSRRELDVLEHLMRRAGRVVPKDLLEEKLYDADHSPDSNPIPVHIHNLRRKLDQSDAGVEIHTIRGVGYLVHARA
ncbi:MAG: response regulator transcription factor [Gammaproteobacteria bacterium]|nr:response regulator transcription factor [Gammaproteobacteria bacterium]